MFLLGKPAPVPSTLPQYCHKQVSAVHAHKYQKPEASLYACVLYDCAYYAVLMVLTVFMQLH
jgi:hypothetical protein